MLSNLPNKIIKYLIDKLPPYSGILMIKTNKDGSIIDFYGPHKYYLPTEPEIGKHIHEYIPALFSMMIPNTLPIVLNNIQLNNSLYADIHIVNTSTDEFWIFIVDQNYTVATIKDELQKINESNFRSESAKTNTIDKSFNPFEVFNYLNLLIIDNETAIIDSSIPQWFSMIKPELKKNDKINTVEIFPYIEVFNLEANEFWNNKKNGKIRSGIWGETLNNGEEIALAAFAVYYNTQKYIFIRPEDKISNEQVALQMAREQKLAYEKLAKAEKKLKILLDYKDKFISIVSHDLRSPVAAVLGIANMLISDEQELSKLDDFYVEMIHSIKDEMERLLDYNDKLYHWSNLELGNFEVVKTKQSLENIIKTAHRTVAEKLKSKNISFSTNLATDVLINVDIALFLQVFNNLLSNAIKFTPQNGYISIDSTIGKELKISITDSGVGMPKKVMSNIFSGFARSSSIGTSGEKGTGLGLGIVKKIVDAHGFTITVESELGKGSSFIITIDSYTKQ